MIVNAIYIISCNMSLFVSSWELIYIPLFSEIFFKWFVVSTLFQFALMELSRKKKSVHHLLFIYIRLVGTWEMSRKFYKKKKKNSCEWKFQTRRWNTDRCCHRVDVLGETQVRKFPTRSRVRTAETERNGMETEIREGERKKKGWRRVCVAVVARVG